MTAAARPKQSARLAKERAETLPHCTAQEPNTGRHRTKNHSRHGRWPRALSPTVQRCTLISCPFSTCPCPLPPFSRVRLPSSPPLYRVTALSSPPSSSREPPLATGSSSFSSLSPHISSITSPSPPPSPAPAAAEPPIFSSPLSPPSSPELVYVPDSQSPTVLRDAAEVPGAALFLLAPPSASPPGQLVSIAGAAADAAEAPRHPCPPPPKLLDTPSAATSCTQLIITTYGELDKNNYLDPRTAQVATVDHIKQRR
ncbi:hypothetical protein U9M48_023411 [Paspalum notatum var. saurae]|uniref:Uncharacterized protein n=1 Tax=Paspalum notatum var. saurae TaxID=547442 RepID=A0AAQ3WW37_PASNO